MHRAVSPSRSPDSTTPLWRNPDFIQDKFPSAFGRVGPNRAGRGCLPFVALPSRTSPEIIFCLHFSQVHGLWHCASRAQEGPEWRPAGCTSLRGRGHFQSLHQTDLFDEYANTKRVEAGPAEPFPTEEDRLAQGQAISWTPIPPGSETRTIPIQPYRPASSSATSTPVRKFISAWPVLSANARLLPCDRRLH